MAKVHSEGWCVQACIDAVVVRHRCCEGLVSRLSRRRHTKVDRSLRTFAGRWPSPLGRVACATSIGAAGLRHRVAKHLWDNEVPGTSQALLLTSIQTPSDGAWRCGLPSQLGCFGRETAQIPRIMCQTALHTRASAPHPPGTSPYNAGRVQRRSWQFEGQVAALSKHQSDCRLSGRSLISRQNVPRN